MKNIKAMIKMMMPNNYTRKDRKEKEKVDEIFKKLVWKKKILQNYDEFNQLVSPLLDEDKMTIKPVVHDRKKVESEIITKLGPQYNWLKEITAAKKISPKAKKISPKAKKTSPKTKTAKKPLPTLLAVPRCKANEIINPTTGKCMRITTMIKQIVKKNKLALKEDDIDFFMDVAREKKLTLGSEREITSALYILLNSGIFKSK
jgi:hypothetical protein